MTIEERSFTALARASEGSMRDGLSLLDQAIAFGGKTIAHADLEVLLGAVPQELVQGLIAAILAQDSPAALTVVANLLDQGHDLKAFCADVVEHLRNLLVSSVIPASTDLRGLIEASEEDIQQLVTEAKRLTPEQLQELLTMFSQAEDSLRFTAHPRFVLEATAVRATRLLRQSEIRAHVSPPAASTPLLPKTVASPPPGRPAPAIASTKPSAMATPAASRQVPPAETQARPKPETSPKPLPSPSAQQTAQPPAAPRPGVEPIAPTPVPVVKASDTPVNQPSSSLNWELVQEEVAASFPNFAPFLETGRYIGLEGNHVTIGFGKQSTLARSMLEKEDNLRALASLCEKQVGHPVKIRVVELSEADPPGPTMAQLRAAKEQEQRVVLFEQARANPVVKQALEIFGADLADVRTVAHKEAGE